jgi:hypothetical protein
MVMSTAAKRDHETTPRESQHGIVRDESAQDQPADRKRARAAAITEQKEDELQPLKEQSGF